MVYAPSSICPGEWDTLTPMGLWHTNGSLNLCQTTRQYNDQQKKMRFCKIVDFAVSADHRMKLKACENYLDLARELKKLWNMELTFTLIVIGSQGTINKGLKKGREDFEIRGRVVTIQTNESLRSDRILRRYWRLEETCLHSSFSERLSANTDVKNSQRVNNDNDLRFSFMWQILRQYSSNQTYQQRQ